jgi:hypothetical protein
VSGLEFEHAADDGFAASAHFGRPLGRKIDPSRRVSAQRRWTSIDDGRYWARTTLRREESPQALDFQRALELWPGLMCCTCEPDEILAARLSEGGATDVSAWLRADRRR